MNSDEEEQEELRRYERDLFADDEADVSGSGGSDVEKSENNADTHGRDQEEGSDLEREGANQSVHEDETQSAQHSNDKESEKKQKAKKPVGPRKHMLLHEDVLCGKNGLIKIGEIFKDFRFGGKGREQKDLDRVLHRLEHWVHLMYPRQPFGQTLDRIEYLGLKRRSVKTYIKKIRMGLISNFDKYDDLLNLNNDDSDEEVRADPSISDGVRNDEHREYPPQSQLQSIDHDEIPSDDDFPFGLFDNQNLEPDASVALENSLHDGDGQRISKRRRILSESDDETPELNLNLESHDTTGDSLTRNDDDDGLDLRPENVVEMVDNGIHNNDQVDSTIPLMDVEDSS